MGQGTATFRSTAVRVLLIQLLSILGLLFLQARYTA